MSELLHESEGLRIVKNAKNGFIVATLFFHADPAKRSPEWRAEAAAGMTQADFAKEYLIDYTAKLGQRVFPQLAKYKDRIVVPAAIELPTDVPCYGGFDYGTRNASSFHVYLCWDDVWYSVWELFKPCTNLSEFCSEMKACPYWGRIQHIAADKNLWNRTQQRDGGLVSLHQLFWEHGIVKLMPGMQDEQAFIALMHQHWRDLDTNREPTFKILDCCPNQIRELESAIYISASERELQSRNLREEIANRDNHSIDDLKYFFLSAAAPKKSKLKWPNLSKYWVH